jgi:nucleotide-binding universal stress UspA family protein
MDEDIPVINNLLPLASALGASITVAHISLPSENNSKQRLEDFKEHVKESGLDENLEFTMVKADSISDGAEEVAKEKNAQLIVMLSRHRVPFEEIYRPSITKKITRKSDIPVLVFHL